MRLVIGVLSAMLVVSGMVDENTARADESAVVQTTDQAAPSTTAEVDTSSEVNVPVQKAQAEVRRGGLLGGPSGWVIAGLVGALVPIVLFALPFIWAPWAGPLSLPFLGAAMLWGTLMVTAGGGLAWLLSALFSDVRGGFFLPILTSAGVGLAGTVLSGILATLSIWPFFLYAVYQAGPQAANVNYWTNRGVRNPVPWIGVLAGFVVWSMGVVTTSIAGPLMAAWVYRERGTPRQAEAGAGYYE
ncbi:MAG: hypothetical protein AB2A00_29150 [Myxococcota bacterium]